MHSLLICLIYLGLLGLVAFPFGRLIAKKELDYNRFPFREYSWEDGGKFYNRVFKIKKWKDRVPDVSKVVPGIVPKKTIGKTGLKEIDMMIQETCVAELTHLILCPLSVPIMFIIQGWAGVVLFIIDVIFGNMQFVIIQRYNRFRYIAARRKIESINSKCQYGNRT